MIVAALKEDGAVISIRSAAIFMQFVTPVWMCRWQPQVYMVEKHDS